MSQTFWPTSLTGFLVKFFSMVAAVFSARLFPTFYFMADLISTWRLCIVHQALGPNLSSHVLIFALTWRARSKPAITSSVTLAALCWILHGHIDLVTPSLFMAMGGKHQKGYTRACMHAYLKGGGYGRFKEASGWKDKCGRCRWLHCLKHKSNVTNLCACCLYVRVWTQSVLGQKRVWE